jgi:DnaB-like helicase N terminal domain
MSGLLNKTPQEAAADLEATNNFAKSLLEAFKNLVRGFLPGITITKKKPLKIEAKQQKSQSQPERLANPNKPAKIGSQQKPDGNSHSEKLRQRDRIYGLGINKLTSADLQAIVAIVNGQKGTKIVGNDDYIIRHNGKIIFETTMGEVTTHTRLSNELRDRIVGLKAGISQSQTSAPVPSKSAKSERVPSNLASEIKDFATESDSFVSPEEAKNLMKTYRQLTQGIVPEPNSNLAQPLEKLDIAIEVDGAAISPELIGEIDNQPNPSIPLSETSKPIKSRAIATSSVEVTETERSVSTSGKDLKIVSFLFNLFGRNTDKENHNTNNGREGILELPTGTKLINKIDKGTAYLSLMRDDIVYEIGSYSHTTKNYAVGSGMVNINAELAELKPYIDSQTLTIAEHNRNLLERAQEQRQPSHKSIIKPVVKQNNSQLDSINFINVEAEENLLAKILTARDALEQSTKQGISDRSFFVSQYQQIFKSARSIQARDEEVNLLSVGDVMQSRNPDINKSLVAIVSRDNPTVSLNSVTSIVRGNQIGREILQFATQLKIDAYNRHKPIFETTRENLEAIANIHNSSYSPAPPAPTAPPLIEELRDRRSEEQIIAAILQVPQATDYLTKAGLTGDCFTHPEHQEIYTVAQGLNRHQEEVNLLSVRNRLKQKEAATTASNIVESTLVLPIDIHVGRVIELRQRCELLNVADMLGRVLPQSSTEGLLNVLTEVKTAIEQTAANSLKLPELKIEEPQSKPERSLQQHPSRGM